MPNVSVIVSNYNHARFLRQRIDSVLGQTYQDFELILLDDCSTDEIAEQTTMRTSAPRNDSYLCRRRSRQSRLPIAVRGGLL
jgi:GT2 family glycosyltransferase